MPDTSVSGARIRELTAERNAIIDANEQLHRDLVAAVDAVFATYAERIAAVSMALKQERAGTKMTNGRHKR